MVVGGRPSRHWPISSGLKALFPEESFATLFDREPAKSAEKGLIARRDRKG